MGTRETPMTLNTKASGHQSNPFLFYGSIFISISMYFNLLKPEYTIVEVISWSKYTMHVIKIKHT
jgi:hypothetical protein